MQRKPRALVGGLSVSTSVMVTLGAAAASLVISAPAAAGLQDAAATRPAVANSQLAFVPWSRGHARFAAHGPDYAIYFRAGDVVVARTRDGRHGAAVGIRFVGANPAAHLTADHPLSTRVSYFVGRRKDWQAGLNAFGRVVYHELWPGIDAAFTGCGGSLKYEFVVHPGADPRAIRLAYKGVRRMRLGSAGDLLLPTQIGTLRDQHPVAFQMRGGRKVPVPARYALSSRREVSFVVGPHEARRALVIDPAIAYSTYLGGGDFDGGLAIAVDSSGSAYVTGRSDSVTFPSTPGAFSVSNAGGGDVFVAKLSPSGDQLSYSTFIGGAGQDEGRGIAVDAAGNAYVTGFTYSDDFPTTASVDRTYGGSGDAWVAKLSASGASLLYSTYLGGESNDRALALAIDSGGVAYVTGETNSPGFPTTAGSAEPTWGGDYDVFVTAVNTTGTALVYSTFVGGPGFDDGLAIAVDSSYSAYVTGKASPGFPVTDGALDATQNGGYDSFVAKLDASGSRFVYSTYLGGAAWDEGLGIAVDQAGNAYSSGNVQSDDFPTTESAYDRSLDGSVDTFVSKLNSSGSALVYSTYLGGSDWDETDGLAIDEDGNTYIAGHVGSTDFPTTGDAFQPSSQGGVDAFATVLTASGSALAYSTYIGSPDWDGALAIAVDSSRAVYLTGFTNSPSYPTTSGAVDTAGNGDMDAFVTKISMSSPPPPPPPPPEFELGVSPAAQEVVRGNSAVLDVTITSENGFSPDVTLSVAGLPDATAASFSPNPATSSSTLTIQTTTSTPPGGYSLTVTGTSGGITRTADVQFDVHCCPRPG